MSDVRSGRGSTDVSIDEGEVRRGGKACLGNAARSRDHVIAAAEKGLDHACSDALGGASYDDCLVACHTYAPLFRARPSSRTLPHLPSCRSASSRRTTGICTILPLRRDRRMSALHRGCGKSPARFRADLFLFAFWSSQELRFTVLTPPAPRADLQAGDRTIAFRRNGRCSKFVNPISL